MSACLKKRTHSAAVWKFISVNIMTGLSYLSFWSLYRLIEAISDYWIPSKFKEHYKVQYHLCYMIIMFALSILVISLLLPLFDVEDVFA